MKEDTSIIKVTLLVGIIVLCIAALLCSGCQTVAGLGTDINNGARASAKAIQSYGARCVEANNR